MGEARRGMQPPPTDPQTTAFRDRLFSRGTMHLTERVINSFVASSTSFAEQRRRPGPDGAVILRNELDQIQAKANWFREINGKVPIDWRSDVLVRADFQNSGEQGIQLDDDLIDAGASHPNRDVLLAVVKSQTLNASQIAAVMLNIHNAAWLDIFKTQREKGVDEVTIEDAKRIYREAKEAQAAEQSS